MFLDMLRTVNFHGSFFINIGMKCLFKHEISLDDVGVGVLDDPFFKNKSNYKKPFF